MPDRVQIYDNAAQLDREFIDRPTTMIPAQLRQTEARLANFIAAYSVTLKEKVYFSFHNFTKIHIFSLNSKTSQIISLNFSNRAFYIPRVALKAVLPFFNYFG